MELSRQVTDCSNWSEILPQAIKEAKDDKVGKYLEGYKHMVERERQLEELESQTRMSSKYRRFLSYASLSEADKQHEPSGSNPTNQSKGKVYLTSIVRSRSELTSSEKKESGFEVRSLNEGLTRSYISRLDAGEQEEQREPVSFKKKEKADVGAENLNFDDHSENQVDFEKALVKGLPAFDLSSYQLPKDETLRERAVDKIYKENLLAIDRKLYELRDPAEDEKTTRILKTQKPESVLEKTKEINKDLDDEFAAIEKLCEDIELNDARVQESERDVGASVVRVDNQLNGVFDDYGQYIAAKLDAIDTIEDELSKLSRRPLHQA